MTGTAEGIRKARQARDAQRLARVARRMALYRRGAALAAEGWPPYAIGAWLAGAAGLAEPDAELTEIVTRVCATARQRGVR